MGLIPEEAEKKDADKSLPPGVSNGDFKFICSNPAHCVGSVFMFGMEMQKKSSNYIYNVDYVYGTEEQQKMYFEKHIIEVNE